MKEYKIKHIGVFTSGGDSPGMNAAIYGVIKAANANGIKVSGIRKGYEGMIDGDFLSLDIQSLKHNVHRGGTMLKTARSQRFRNLDGRQQALRMLQATGIDAVIAIGGDGTFRGLLAFSEICELPFIGIPGTIDNDLAGTDYTLGFDSAVNTAIENIDKIRDTAESHNRVFLIEVMGRDAGYIGIYSGLATAADSILIPESIEDFPSLLHNIKNYKSEEAFIAVVSEGDELGTEYLASQIKEINPNIDLRITRLGHIQRGGNPSAFDRILGIRLGVASVNALISGEKNSMAGLLNNQLALTPFQQVVKQHEVNEEIRSLLKLLRD